MRVEQLAQRALGDVFEQLARIGEEGRTRCSPYSTTHYAAATLSPLEQQLKRHEAVELLRMAENALDYARVHLDYLPRDKRAELEPLPFAPGEPVVVTDEEESWTGTVVGRVSDGRLLLKADRDGTVQEVDPGDVRRAAHEAV